MKEPELESRIAHEILWNDPVSDQEYRDLLQNTRSMTTMMAVLNHNQKNPMIMQNKNNNDNNVEDLDKQQKQHQSGEKKDSTTAVKKSPSDLKKNEEGKKSSSPKQQQQQQSNQTLKWKSGFLPNTKRGTACYYSEEALTKFLDDNHLSHLIRAHEVIPPGYQYHMGGRCLTIFSCSNYCGGINESAVCLINDQKIRVIKIDTNTATMNSTSVVKRKTTPPPQSNTDDDDDDSSTAEEETEEETEDDEEED